jgi:dolichyl-phosphate-mannose-protein mannosyltransferase
MAEVDTQPGGLATSTSPADSPHWRRIAVEAAGYAFLAWAALVAFNVYAFADPAARAAAGGGLSHIAQIITHLPRNFALFFALLFTLGAVIAPGDAVLRLFRLPARDAFDRIAFGTVAGLALLIALAYLLAAVHLLRWEVEATALIAGFVASALAVPRWIKAGSLVPDTVRTSRLLTGIFLAILAVTLYVALLAALTPEVGFDARYYHLVEAERYAQYGGFYDLVASERMWAYAVPHYQETLYAFQWVLFGAVGAKLIAWGGALACVLALVAFSRAWFGSTAVGVVAAAILFASPVITWSATTANTDLASVPFVILAIHALLTWRETGSRWALCAAGVFAGITYGIKPFGAFTVIAIGVVAAFILLSRRTPKKVAITDLMAYAGCAVLALLPALVSSAWLIGDPVYPLATNLFAARYGSTHVTAVLAGIQGGHGFLNPVNLISLPWTMTVDTLTFRNLLGPIWLTTLPLWVAVPFMVRRHTAVIRSLAGFAIVFWALIFVSGAIEFRYSATAAWVIAVLIAYGLLCLDWRGARTLQAVLVTSVVLFCALDNGLLAGLERNATSQTVMGAPYLNWAYLYEGLPEDSVQLQYVPMLQYTNAHLDAHHDKIYDGVYLEVMNLYSEVPLFNGAGYDGPTGLHEWTLMSPDAYQKLRETGCTYVVVAKATLVPLKTAPVWQHLKFITETPSVNGPTSRDELFKVVDQRGR